MIPNIFCCVLLFVSYTYPLLICFFVVEIIIYSKWSYFATLCKCSVWMCPKLLYVSVFQWHICLDMATNVRFCLSETQVDTLLTLYEEFLDGRLAKMVREAVLQTKRFWEFRCIIWLYIYMFWSFNFSVFIVSYLIMFHMLFQDFRS